MATPLGSHRPDAIASARAGRPDGLSALYEAYGGLVRRIACRITGDPHDGEDVVQDVFLGLPEALRGYEERGRFAEWLSVLTTRTALMRVRRRQRRGEDGFDGVGAPHAAVAGPEAAIAARLTLSQALARLPDDLRIVFVLKEMEGHSHAEIADLLGIRVGTAEVRLHRAIRRLRTILEKSR